MLKRTTQHLNKLNNKIEIAPVNTEEELHAAEYIYDVFESRGLNPQIQEIRTPMSAPLVRSILFVAMFVGAILVGVSVAALSIIGFLFILISCGLLVADYMGKPVFKTYGRPAVSQNVIAKHTGVGEFAGRGTRPIVIVAHYDTPHESLLQRQGLAKYQPWIIKVAAVCVPVVTVLAFIQKIFPLPTAVGIVFWVLMILASLPCLAWGVIGIANHFLPATDGACDNKSSLAAMFDVLDQIVSPIESDLSDDEEDEESVEEEVVETETVVEHEGERHGEQVIRALGILPETCEIEYSYTAQPEVEATVVEETIEPTEDDVDYTDDTSVENTDVMPVAQDLKQVVADEASDEEDDLDATNPLQKVTSQDVEETPEDASWGKTSYMPQMNKFARRAVLNDLPDPLQKASDPFEDSGEFGVVEEEITTIAPANNPSIPKPVRLEKDEVAGSKKSRGGAASKMQSLLHLKDNIKVSSPRNFFSGKKKKAEDDSMSNWLGVDENFDAKKDGQSIGTWDNFNDNDSDWKGGATPSSKFKLIEGTAKDEEPTPEEMRLAIKEITEDGDEAVETVEEEIILDEKLLAHDIWFVALGASALDHAGMETFLKEYRRQIRGSFLINLDCIGAGNLAILKEEGLFNTRKADRRLSRLINSTSKDLSIPLSQVVHSWGDTDATPAMRSSMRSITIMGVEDNMPALSGSAEDIPENVDAAQVRDVAELVCEVIRRS